MKYLFFKLCHSSESEVQLWTCVFLPFDLNHGGDSAKVDTFHCGEVRPEKQKSVISCCLLFFKAVLAAPPVSPGWYLLAASCGYPTLVPGSKRFGGGCGGFFWKIHHPFQVKPPKICSFLSQSLEPQSLRIRHATKLNLFPSQTYKPHLNKLRCMHPYRQNAKMPTNSPQLFRCSTRSTRDQIHKSPINLLGFPSALIQTRFLCLSSSLLVCMLVRPTHMCNINNMWCSTSLSLHHCCTCSIPLC